MINQFWSVTSKVLGGLFLLGGGTVSLGILVGMAVSQPAGWAVTLLTLLLIFFGLAPTALGGGLLYASLQAENRVLRERFFRLLQLNRGRLSLLDYAASTRLEPGVARRHLDRWAREFSATFDVDEEGEIYYVFARYPTPLPEDQTLQAIGQFVQRLLK